MTPGRPVANLDAQTTRCERCPSDHFIGGGEVGLHFQMLERFREEEFWRRAERHFT
jgi:hypothetical protein